MSPCVSGSMRGSVAMLVISSRCVFALLWSKGAVSCGGLLTGCADPSGPSEVSGAVPLETRPSIRSEFLVQVPFIHHHLIAMGEEGSPGTRSPATTAAKTMLPPCHAAPPPPSLGHGSSLSPIVPRSPSLRPMAAVSPPLSPRLMQSAAGSLHHNRSPSFSSNLNVIDLLASQQPNGTKPPVREWAKIPLSELVQGQQLHFIDGDTPVEEACQVMPPLPPSPMRDNFGM